MLYVCTAALGLAAGYTLRWPGVVILVILLAMASGIAGVLQGHSLTTTLVTTSVIVCILEVAYLGPFLLALLHPHASAERPDVEQRKRHG